MVDSKRATHFLVDHFAVIARNRTAERRKNALVCVSLPPTRSSGLVRVLLSPCRGVVTRTIHKNKATKMKKIYKIYKLLSASLNASRFYTRRL